MSQDNLKQAAVAAETEEEHNSVSNMDFDNMTVDEIFAAVEQDEERLRKKKEDVFRRVLHSLTDGQPLSTEAEAVHDSATIAFYESKKLREETRLKADARRRDQEERQRLEKEREQLRRRFEEDSEDAKGVNPILDSEAKYREDGDFAYDLKAQSANVNLESIFGNNHSDIDDFLTELEEELESQAMSKDSVPSTELDRLFQLLDEAAATNAYHQMYTAPSIDATTHTTTTTTTATPSDSDVNFTRFQEEVAAFSLSLPRPPGAKPTTTNTAADAAAQPEALTYKTQPNANATTSISNSSKPTTASTTASSTTQAPVAVGQPNAGAARGIRAEYAETKTASKSTASAAAVSSDAAGEEEEDDEDDLFMASRAKMKSASAIASSQLQKPPAETKPIIPVLTAAARAKISSTVLAMNAADATTNPAAQQSTVSESDSDDVSESESESESDVEDHALVNHDASSEVVAAEEVAEQEQQTIQQTVEGKPVAVVAPVAPTSSSELRTPVKQVSAKPLIEVVSSSPSTSTSAEGLNANTTNKASTEPTIGATAAASSGSLLSGSLLGSSGSSSSRSSKQQKGKVVMTNTRTSQKSSSSSSSSASAAAETSTVDDSASSGTTTAAAAVSSPSSSPNKPTVAATDPLASVTDTTASAAAAAVAPTTPAVEDSKIPVPEEKEEIIQVPTTVPLDVLASASVLPVFPWTCLAQKSTGMMISALWNKSLAANTVASADGSSSVAREDERDGSIDDITCELQDIVVVAFNAEDSAADHEVFLLFEWVLRQVHESMTLVGFLRGALDEDTKGGRYTQHQYNQSLYHLAVFRKQSEDVSVHYVQQISQVTKLQDILPLRAANNAASVPSATAASNKSTPSSRTYVSDMLSLYEFYDLPERVMNQVIAAHRSQLSDSLTLPTGILPSQVHIAPAIFRTESLVVQGAVSQGALSSLTKQAEGQGLRVVGTRLLHLTPSLIQEVKKVLNIEVSAAASFAPLSSILVVSFASIHGENAADILRGIIGPEDPVLARKTDPQSIRAIYGGQRRDDNVVLPLSYAKEKLLREVSYWFGPRVPQSQGYHMLVLPKVTLVELGVRLVQYLPISTTASTTVAAHASSQATDSMWVGDNVAKIQRLILEGVVSALEEHGHLQYMQGMSLGDFATRMFRVKPVYVYKSEDSIGELETMLGAQCLVWRLETMVSASFLATVWQKVLADIAVSLQNMSKLHGQTASTTSSSVAVTVYMVTTNGTGGTSSDALLATPPVSQQQGSQYLAQQIVSKLSVHDYRSHEDVGLSDTILLAFQLNGISAGTNVSVTTSSVCRFLPMLFERLPPSVHAHIVGAVTSADGNVLYVIVRGYQIIETIDNVVRDIQAQYQQLLTPVAMQLAQLRTSASSNTTYATGHINVSDFLAANVVSVIRGRRALERILQLFSLNTLYIQPAVEDIRRYVPNSYQFIPDDLFANQGCLEHHEQNTQSSVLAKAIAHALFPPGVFTAMGVLVLPIQPFPSGSLHQSATGAAGNSHQQHQQEMNHMLLMMRYQVATLSRLHKDDFTVLAMQATEALSTECYERLCRENFETYIEEYRSAGLTWDDVVERFHIDRLFEADVQIQEGKEEDKTVAQTDVALVNEPVVDVSSIEAPAILPPIPPPVVPKERGATAADSIGIHDSVDELFDKVPSSVGLKQAAVAVTSPEPLPAPPVISKKPAPAAIPTKRVVPALDGMKKRDTYVAPPAALIVLVARKSALLKLRHCVGPVLDDGVASDKYPRSLTSLFASLFPGQVLSSNKDIDIDGQGSTSPKRSPALQNRATALLTNGGTHIERYPFLLTSLTCATAEWMVKKYLPAHRDVFVSLKQEQIAGNSDDDHDSMSHDFFRAAESLFGIDVAFQDRLLSVLSPSNTSSSVPPISSSNLSTAVNRKLSSRFVSVLLKNEIQELLAKKGLSNSLVPSSADSSSSLLDSVDSKTVDIAGVIITSALIAHHGLDTILDVIHREGLVVVNSTTTKLTMPMVKILSEAAGMSSLTLKPSNQNMLTGPVVVLGLYGPIHAFVRLKSFQVQSARGISSGNAASSTQAVATSLWTLPNGESGVLASSSSRLARQLYGLCFDRVLFHSNECPFLVVEDVQL